VGREIALPANLDPLLRITARSNRAHPRSQHVGSILGNTSCRALGQMFAVHNAARRTDAIMQMTKRGTQRRHPARL
jgi:hypothetical protein